MTDWQHGGDAGGAPRYDGPPGTGRPGGDPQYPPAGGYQPGYPPQPEYPQQPGYPPVPYPGYPPAYPPPYGYAIPVPYPVPAGPARPGLVTAASVLGYINAGFLILAGALLMFGASLFDSLDDLDGRHTNYGTELRIDGIVNFIAAGLILAGAVQFSGRNPTGRLLLSIGNAIVIAESIYWLVRFDDANIGSGGWVFYAVLFGTLAVLPLAFSFTADNNRWLAGEPPRR